MIETKWYKALSFLHLIVVLSLVFFGTTLCSGTLLFLPSLCGAFSIGRDLLEGRFNVYDGLVKRFYKELFHYRKIMRYFPAQIILVLQLVGILVFREQLSFFMRSGMLAIGALMLTIMCYICGYAVFLKENIRCEEVVIKMFMQVGILISLFALMILILLFFRLKAVPVLLLAGALPVLAVEACIYYTVKKEP